MHELIESKEFSEAHEILNELLDKYPADPHLYFEFGLCNAYQKEYERAIIYFKIVAKFIPDHVEAWHNMGQAFYEMGNTVDAIYAAKKVLKFSAGKKEYEELVKINQDYIIEVKEYLKEDLDITLNQYLKSAKNFDLAYEKFTEFEYKLAIKYLDTDKKNNFKCPLSQWLYSACYAMLGEKDMAILHNEKCLEKSPTIDIIIENMSQLQSMIDGVPFKIRSPF